MKKIYILLIFGALFLIMCAQDNQQNKQNNQLNHAITMKFNKLSPEEERVIIYKGTEVPFSGELLNNNEKGTYICKRCDTPLYRSEDKFDGDRKSVV